MTTQQIGYFIRLAQELNYARVAREFYITQPTLSRQIINLENELKLNLFIRDRNSVELTPEGKYFYEHVKPVFQELLDVISSAQKIKTDEDHITIGVQDDQVISNPLMVAISRLRYEYPDITVAIHKADPDELLDKLDTGEFDLLNLVMIPTFRQDDRQAFYLLEEESIYLVYSAQMPDLGPAVSKEFLYHFLDEHNLIMPILHGSENDEQARKYFAANMPSLDPERVIHHLTQSGRAISLPIQVASNLGVSLSSYSTVYSIDPQLRIAKVEGTEGTYRKGIMYQKVRNNPAADRLIEILTSFPGLTK